MRSVLPSLSHPSSCLGKDTYRSPSSSHRSSESQINVLADQIAHVSADATLSDALANESAARTALAEAQRRLETYEKVLGPDPLIGNDLVRMGKKLEEKQEALRVMDLKVKENEAVSLSFFLSSRTRRREDES